MSTEPAAWLLALRDSALRRSFGPALLQRAEALRAAVGEIEAGHRGATQWQQAEVQGSRRYRVRLLLNPGSLLRGQCDCAQAQLGRACKHQAALALQLKRQLGGPAQAGAATRVQQPTEPAEAAAAALALLHAALPTPEADSRAALAQALAQWQQQSPPLAWAAAEALLRASQARLALLDQAPGWAEGLADWQALHALTRDALLAAWCAQGPPPAREATRYLALVEAGALQPQQALPHLGAALAGRAQQLLERRWQHSGDAAALLAHLDASGDSAGRLRVLALSRHHEAGHAAYIQALLDAGRGREALAAAEQACRAHPLSQALRAQLRALYEADGWDAEAAALRPPASRPIDALKTALLRRLPPRPHQPAATMPRMTAALLESNLHSLPLLARGKVRDNYAVGADRILMVASDRISAFDVVMGEPIPGKGAMLTQMALFWFERLAHVVPNHLTGDDPLSVVAADERAQVQGRAMLVKRLRPLPIEAVVRGYLAGSGWKEYQASQAVCGVALPAGLHNASRLPEPIFTPATKAAVGDHDENISFEQAAALIGPERAAEVREVAIRLYREAAAYALTQGIIIADTKFEFGLDEQDRLTLMDEVLTPDSSRYWPVDGYEAAHQSGANPPSFDKQFLRDWLEAQPWGKTAPAPALPPEVVAQTAATYAEALRRLGVGA